MKAVKYHGPRNLELIETAIPSPGIGEVLIKIEYCGICGTDIHAYQMEGIFDWELIPGHEGVGIVAQIGEGVDCVSVGDRVAIGPPGDCGDCYSCNTGNPNTCPDAFPNTLGIGPDTKGAFAQYVLSKYPKNELFKIPDEVSLDDAALFDILGVGFHSVRRSNMRVGDSAVVSGCGAIGLSVIQAARLAGAYPIVAFATKAAKRELALACGADYAFDPARAEDISEAKSLLKRTDGAQVCYEAAGSPGSIGTCLELCMPSGQIMMIGTDGRPFPLVTGAVGPRQIDMNFSFTYTKEEIIKVFDLIRSGRLDVSPYTRVKVALEDAVSALEDLATRKLDVARVLLTPNAGGSRDGAQPDG